MPLLFLFPILLLFLFLHPAATTKTQFDFGTLTLSSLKLLGDAHLRNGSVLLTRDLAVPNSGAGRALYSHPVRFRRPGPTSSSLASFTTFFTFSVTNLNPSSIGGGLAFVLSPDDFSLGAAGGFLGLGGTTTGFLGIEFDTLMDVEFNDVNGNHVGLDLGTMVSDRVADLGSIHVDLKNGDSINCWVEFNGSNRVLDVRVGYSNVRPTEPVLYVEGLELDEYVNDFMFVGFSGSTQGSTETHSIDWWSFSSSFDDVLGSGSSSLGPFPSLPMASLIVPMGNGPYLAPMWPGLGPAEAESVVVHRAKRGNCHHSKLCKKNPGAVAGLVAGCVLVLALFVGALIWVFAKKSKACRRSSGSLVSSGLIKMPKEFSYKELRLATDGFHSDRIIGHGAFGMVYRGMLPRAGDLVAVKRCRQHGEQEKNEFLSELSIIGSLRHRNLVKLQGWCHEKGEILLVYDFMPNGSLDKALFESRMVLPWTHRRKILLGVASALAYLHTECENQVIHRDVKTSNIMLDERFNARLGDFGLAREIEHDKSSSSTSAAGTIGYLAPEYLITGRATEKTDVFSYGVVVLEVASGRRPIETNQVNEMRSGVCYNLVEWVWSLYKEGRLLTAVDPMLRGEFARKDMRKVLLVGLACSHPDPLARPTMRNVIQMLVGEAEVPIVPRTKPPMTYTTSQPLSSSSLDSFTDCNTRFAMSVLSSENSPPGVHLIRR